MAAGPAPGGSGCPPDDYCKAARATLEALYRRLKEMDVSPGNSQTGYEILQLRRQFNQAVDDYNKLCAKSSAGPFVDKLIVGPQRPYIPGRELLKDFYLRGP